MNELQRAILREHEAVSRGERGAKARLEELQRQFRTGRHLVERPGGTARLTEPGTMASPRRVKHQTQRKRRRASSRTQDAPPYWQLGNQRHESWRLR